MRDQRRVRFSQGGASLSALENMPKLLWAGISVGLYVLGCFLPALAMEEPTALASPLPGYACLALGLPLWSFLLASDMGRLGGLLLGLSWLANFPAALAVAAIIGARTGQWAMRLGLASTGLALLTALLFATHVPVDAGSYPDYISGIGLGYALWVAALVTPIVAGYVVSRRSSPGG